MKIFRSLGAGAAVLLAVATAAPAAPERPSAPGDPMPARVLDAETNTVTFATPHIDLQPWPQLVRIEAQFSYTEPEARRPEKVVLTVTRSGTRDRWRPGEQLTFRTGGQRMFWSSEVSAKDVEGHIIETARTEIETPFFISLVQADSIDLEIGKTRGVLDQGWLRPLKELARRIPAR